MTEDQINERFQQSGHWPTSRMKPPLFVFCSLCGFVRRADGSNSPCKGIVRIALRELNDSQL